ncbi:MAG TPA: thioredoxin domain-containing protein [Candidatus Absconditabacterales bacterium]|nr:thioredoxin domain-containing protein [Candidatus Absconditabacterales bacterium]HMT26720.1 thioredoxin domain-containing protein [Candidatus Absconditabacterales bacterium]
MQNLTQTTFSQSIQTGAFVVDFYADRCGPCKMLKPYLEELASKLAGKVTFFKVDVDAEMNLAQQQDISAMPTIKFFKDGELIETVIGANIEAINAAIVKLQS